MTKQIFTYVILAIILNITSLNHANTLFHWDFDGHEGDILISELDTISDANLIKFGNFNSTYEILHGNTNPWFNTTGTSAVFLNDPIYKEVGIALAVVDTGENTDLDLSMNEAFTIEFFLFPSGLNNCVLVGKGNSDSGYFIKLFFDGKISFSINSDNNSISTGSNVIQRGKWYHIAAVFDKADKSTPMKLFVDGILSASGGNNTQVNDSTNSFSIGTYVDNNYNPPRSGSNKFSGKLDELRISDIALGTNEFLINTVKTKALYPYPENHADQFSRTTHLTWQPAKGVSGQRIYFGLNPDNLDFIAEVDPETNILSNQQIGGKLQQGATYYWRVDSKGNQIIDDVNENVDYGFDGEGKGEVWSFTTQDNILHDGHIKWLLHLGQSPDDMILSGGSGQLQLFGGEPNISPTVGEIYDFSETFCNTSHDLLIWTPQYSSTGLFEGYGFDEFGIQYYHIYIRSSQERDVRLNIRDFESISVWCNGNLVMINAGGQERWCDLTLQQGYNSILFKLSVSISFGRGYDSNWYYLNARFTDFNDQPLDGLTYSLESPTPEQDIYVYRKLPDEYDPNKDIKVTLEIDANQELEQNEASIIEIIPDGTQIIDSGGGYVNGNSIQWVYPLNSDSSEEIYYTLLVSENQVEPISFLGYVYINKQLEEIAGDELIFDEKQISPVDMEMTLDTIEINTTDFISSEEVIIDGSRFNFNGVSPASADGWAKYEFNIKHPDRYNIIIDYAEYWTSFHNIASLKLILDDNEFIEAELYPTTHSYLNFGVTSPSFDPERKALWLVGHVELTAGTHTVTVSFNQMQDVSGKTERNIDITPVIRKITFINYPSLNLPYFAEPHHLDSYEHAPARLVHSRDITTLPDGRVEITYYGTFYSLSQGNEVYFANWENLPKPDSETSLFEFVSFEPDVFHLPPNGEQDFTLTVRSVEPVTPNYSELFILWLQGPPSNPARKPYLFCTGQSYIELPPYRRDEYPWNQPLFDIVQYDSMLAPGDITDDPEQWIPDRASLGFFNGRYEHSLGSFILKQVQDGVLPSIASIFQNKGWDINQISPRDVSKLMPHLFARLYTSDYRQLVKDYVQRFSENLVFYPVTYRWDWVRPYYFSPYSFDTIAGKNLLAAYVRTAQEGSISDEEQFRILHNLVLPIFNSYWDELRVTAFLAQDANVGDKLIFLDRSAYGVTGSPVDGFSTIPPGYIKIGNDLHEIINGTDYNNLILKKPLSKSYLKGTPVTSWAYIEELELEGRDLRSLVVLAAASRDWAVIDEALKNISDILTEQNIFLEDGSFRNPPGSYATGYDYYLTAVMLRRLFGNEALKAIPQEIWDKFYNGLIYTCEFPFSNGQVPSLTGGGTVNQLSRDYFHGVELLEELFPDDTENISLYKRISNQEKNRQPGDLIDNHNFVIHGWGYAMLRSEGRTWDRGMETLLASKYLMSNPGDHVSHDCLGIVLYGLGTILTPRYGGCWAAFAPPFMNQIMIDNSPWENEYYGSYWHFDGREELPSAVAHTGDGDNCSNLNFDMSRWCIQFPEYLFDTYFIKAKDLDTHQYEWNLFNMGEMEIVEPKALTWDACPEFLDGYWPTIGTRGAGERTIATKPAGRIIADWYISDGSWDPYGDPKLLRYTPAHNGRLRLIACDNSSSSLINAQIGFYPCPASDFQANSQDILVIRKNAISHAFVNTLEAIADDKEAYVIDVEVIDNGNHNQQLVKVTTSEGEDWIYLSGQWNSGPNGENPVSGIYTDADIVVWRIVNNATKRIYIANGSYANTAYGSWNFGTVGNHYIEY